MNADHCKKERKIGRGMEEKKKAAVRELLGEDTILDDLSQKTDLAFQTGHAEMIEKAGGLEIWNALPQPDQALQTASMIREVTISLGEDAYAQLSADEQHDLDFFVWVGCGCHKEGNSVKGGAQAMAAWWEEAGIKGPILLANRDNKAVLKNINPDSDVLTPPEEHAFEVTARGGIKASSIAGAIFNHKDDKKGQQDTYKFWFLEAGIPLSFPDTSNVRYQSHCDGGAVLIQHHKKFLEFLEFVCDSKEKPGLNNMEQNLYLALQDPPTLTELATLALYAQAVSHPYMAQIRSSANINMLDLGPLHKQVEEHIQKLIDNPELLLSSGTSCIDATLDGSEWERPDAIAKILEMRPELPHLADVLVAFLKGALATWKCFTTEFVPGGIIDQASEEQKDLAWMPATNDVNEGILGSYRVFMRGKPNTTLHAFNAQAMYKQNDTQDFMDKNFTEEDHAYVRKMARAIDESGLEKKRKKELIQAQKKQVAEKRTKSQQRTQKKTARAIKLSKAELKWNEEDIPNLRGQKLLDQFAAFKLMGAPFPKKSTDVKNVAQKRAAIIAAIACKKTGKWVPNTILDDGTIDVNEQDKEREENQVEEEEGEEDEEEQDE